MILGQHYTGPRWGRGARGEFSGSSSDGKGTVRPGNPQGHPTADPRYLAKLDISILKVKYKISLKMFLYRMKKTFDVPMSSSLSKNCVTYVGVWGLKGAA